MPIALSGLRDREDIVQKYVWRQTNLNKLSEEKTLRKSEKE